MQPNPGRTLARGMPLTLLRPTEGKSLGGNLTVIGLNHRSAPVEVRERFWIGESRLFPALATLSGSPGIEEVVVLATCNRTEFIL